MTQEYAAVREELDNLTETVKILAVEVNALRHPMIYDYIDENMPQWARPTIQKLCEKGFLKGDEGGLNLDENPASAAGNQRPRRRLWRVVRHLTQS